MSRKWRRAIVIGILWGGGWAVLNAVIGQAPQEGIGIGIVATLAFEWGWDDRAHKEDLRRCINPGHFHAEGE